MESRLRRNSLGVLLVLGILAAFMALSRSGSGPNSSLVRRMIDEAPTLIARLPEKDNSHELTHWFKALVKSGHLGEARAMAASIDRPRLKSQALAGVATGLFEAGRMDEAREVARSIADPGLRDQTLHIVSIGFAGLQGTKNTDSPLPLLVDGSKGIKSVETASEVKDASQRDSGLASSSLVLRMMNSDATADVADSRIVGATARDQAQATKASILGLKGQATEAIDTALRVRDPRQRIHALLGVASVLADRSRAMAKSATPVVIGGNAIDGQSMTDGAIRAAARAVKEARDSKTDLSSALTAQVDVLGKVGRFVEARAAAAAIGDAARRAQVQSQLVHWLSEGAQFADALALARTISNRRSRSDALISLIEAVPKVAQGSKTGGTDEVVAATAKAVFAAAGDDADPASRSEALSRASYALALAGRKDEALRAAREAFVSAREVTGQEPRAYHLSDAAGAWARAEPGREAAGAARDALVASAPLGSPFWEDGPLQRAARALIEALSPEKAIAFAETIDDPLARALALAALGDSLGGYGWDEKVVPATLAAKGALRAVAAISDPEVRASTLTTIIDLAGRASLADQALAIAHTIPSTQSAKRSEAYQALATSEAEHAHFDRAVDIAQACAPDRRLTVYATILDINATEPANRRFARKAAAVRDHGG